MMDSNTAGLLRLIGLVGLSISILVWALAGRSTARKILEFVSAGAALFSVLLYLVAVMAAADSGASRFLPRFP